MNSLFTTVIVLALLPFVIATILALLATAILLRKILWRLAATFALVLVGLYAYSSKGMDQTLHLILFIIVYFGIGFTWASLWESLKEDDRKPSSPQGRD